MVQDAHGGPPRSPDGPLLGARPAGRRRRDQHFHHVDAPARQPGSGRQGPRGLRAAGQVAAAHARRGAEARAVAAGLHLHDHQRVRAAADQVQLASGRAQAAGERPQARAAQEACGDALAGQPALRPREPRQRPRGAQPRREPREQATGRPPRPYGALASGSASMLWTAARLKRIRTPSATCSVTTSSWTAATTA